MDGIFGVILIACVCALAVRGIAATAPPATSLESAFSPPREFEGVLGAFRSPLLFDDGTPVRGQKDWGKRRAEIRQAWTSAMGAWPELLEAPRLEVLSESQREGVIWKRVKVPMARDVSGEGWLLIPEGQRPRPCALVVYYDPETSVGLNPKQPNRDFGLQLTRRGFVTLSLGTPGGNAWKPARGAATCQPLSFHAYIAGNCWNALAALPEVDRERIAVVGHSYGGKWALFAAALWEKFAAVAVSDPGVMFDEARSNVNYWEPWYLGFDPAITRPPGVPSAANPRTGAYRRLVDEGHDLHEIHALIAPRPFLVSGGAEDPPSRWVALNHLRAVNVLLGASNRVALTTRAGHDPTPESNAQLVAFLERFLQSQR